MSQPKMCPMTRMLNPGIEGFACVRELCEWWVEEKTIEWIDIGTRETFLFPAHCAIKDSDDRLRRIL